MSQVQTVDDNFVVGTLFFFCFAGALLLVGKVRFGMVYMIGIIGFALLYYVFKYMTLSGGLTAAHLFTALSYCTIPLVPHVIIIAILRFSALTLTIFATPFVAWSAFSAMRYVMTQVKPDDLKILVFVPLFLFYSFLLLLPVY
jgi:hypothetical protein